ncbi:pentatricopeptide repeat-containing protein At4g38150 [Impatiens glandulifera]|uniref:pentatricopeptide repeat-containing protein At4g38150 n=1 Tax=Impatiens glandulifera TaxID=253017 RepID=UPI001FB0732D|nr:pentatricopeptide repeat-containing protein At4g38150 [Impatiens glandulifera]
MLRQGLKAKSSFCFCNLKLNLHQSRFTPTPSLFRIFSFIHSDNGDARRPRFNSRELPNRDNDNDGRRPSSGYESKHRGLREVDDEISGLKTRVLPSESSSTGSQLGQEFLEKFRLGFDKGEKNDSRVSETSSILNENQASPPPDADEIFKKMKETGLIPNAVAMLDGLCKDGLVQEAMKLFGLMREKGTMPEVVIYTAVVEGFCKAQKLDEAMRIFRKMQKNGISPNAFSYTVFIKGLYEGNQLEDAVELCLEMLEAGHSPNMATFVAIVDCFCREKGVEEAQRAIGELRQKGCCFDERAVKDYLEKKGPYLAIVWEAIFGKKNQERPF